MSLAPIESVQLNSYFQGGNFSTGAWHFFQGPISGPPNFGHFYYDRLDAFVAALGRDVSDPAEGLTYFDPLFVDNTSPQFFFANSTTPSFIAVGYWDKVAGTQPLYAGPNVSSAEFWPIDTATLVFTDIGSSLWPFFWDGGGGGIGVVGGWDDGPTAQTESDFVFFETWGYALSVKRVKHTDGNLYRGLAQIDLATGSAVLLDTAAYFATAPGALFESFKFQGDAFTLTGLQFVPDDDSQPAAPKGRLFMSSADFLSVLGNVSNADWRQYMKVIDWNPLGATAQPGSANRVHLRQTLLTRLNFFERQAFGTNLNSLGDTVPPGSGSANGLLFTRFHPPTRTFVTINEHGTAGTIHERGYVRTSLSPELAQVLTPTQLTDVRTARRVRFRTSALGDIGDPIGGLPATWSLARGSTIEEAFDTSANPASVFVANDPIDTGTLVFSKDGTPLTLTTDYTVNEGTGEITGAGAHAPLQASGYTASYRHTTNPATPAHGTLITTTSRTDELGNAETQVDYADDDDLVEDRDLLTVSITDD
jgi:hypothetical protein